MFSTPWICRRCINTALKPSKRRLLRFASTESHAAISPTLLARARNMAKEHRILSALSLETFSAKTSKRIGELKSVAGALEEFEDTEKSLSELNELLRDPKIDPELRDIGLVDLGITNARLERVTKSLTAALTPKHPFEDLPCLIEIRPGVGGGEAAIFAADLLRMYRSYCSQHRLRANLMKYEVSETSGDQALAEAILEIDSPGAYGKLRSEAGVHRVQRVPATESKGRTHTSAAAVMVLPSIPSTGGDQMGELDLNDPSSDYYVDVTKVRVDVMRARGAGGQHVNTTDSAVRLTHLPTNTVVNMQDSRSQHENREKAWQLLRAKLADAKREAREEELAKIRRGVIGVAKMGRGDKVRTYNYGQQRVTDHRTGFSSHNLDDVMEGGGELDKIMDSVKAWFGEQELEELLAQEEAWKKDEI